MNTLLITKRIGDIADAARWMGELETNGNFKLTPMVLIPERNPCKFWITIPEGFHAVVTSYDRYVGIWGAGCHLARPWERVSHLVTKQFVVYDTPVKECPTMDNVMVEIDVSIVFHILEDEQAVKNFVYRLGPEALEKMLKAFQEEAVRSMARQKKYSNIYDLMDTEELNVPAVPGSTDTKAGGSPPGDGIEMTAPQDTKYHKVPEQPAHTEKKSRGGGGGTLNQQLENTKRTMNEKLGQYGVSVYSITITNVHLPGQFQKQMEDATTFESKNIKLEAEQKYNLLVISNTQRREQTQQKNNEIKLQMASKQRERLAEETKLTSKVEAETQTVTAKIQEEVKAAVLELKTQSDLRVTKLEKEKEGLLLSLDAKARAEVKRIDSEREAYVAAERAKAQREVAQHNAETLKLQAQAEATASTKLRAKREFEAKMAHLRVLKNMATNRKMTLSGTNRDNMVAQLLSSKNSASTLGLNVTPTPAPH